MIYANIHIIVLWLGIVEMYYGKDCLIAYVSGWGGCLAIFIRGQKWGHLIPNCGITESWAWHMNSNKVYQVGKFGGDLRDFTRIWLRGACGHRRNRYAGFFFHQIIQLSSVMCSKFLKSTAFQTPLQSLLPVSPLSQPDYHFHQQKPHTAETYTSASAFHTRTL